MKVSEWVRREYNQFEDYDEVTERVGWFVPAQVVSGLMAHTMLPPEANILDVGCGTGHVGREMRRRGFKGRLLGLDIAERRLAQAKSSGHYDLTRAGDAYRLPWGFAGFDGVVSSAVLGLAGPQALNEMLRVVRGDRLLSVAAWYVRGRREMERRFDAVLRRLDKLAAAHRVEVLLSRSLGCGASNAVQSPEHYELFVLRKMSHD